MISPSANRTRIANLRAELARAQDRCRRAGIPVYDLPPALADILKAAAVGRKVPEKALSEAITDAGRLAAWLRMLAYCAPTLPDQAMRTNFPR